LVGTFATIITGYKLLKLLQVKDENKKLFFIVQTVEFGGII